MASSSDNISMAVFCDFENVALGVRDANYEKFDIKPVLERLLLKGSIVVKKSYCDWERYKGFKAGMHEANFELIEIPHVRQSGKNSADIRLVVDALDLCYTKSHVNTFVIISGDSDFSPLVSKLRENAKQVIGVGVKQSTSDLLVANCDEFIFYDDLVREKQRAAAKRDERKSQPQAKRPSDDRRKEELEARRTQALEMVAETFDALVSERGDSGKIWASLLKDTLKRRRPDFSETYYGFRTFGNLLEEAQSRGLFEFGRDEKSGAYVYRSSAAPAAPAVEPVQQVQSVPELALAEQLDTSALPESQPEPKPESRRRGRGARKQAGRDEQEMIARADEAVQHQVALAQPVAAQEQAPAEAAEALGEAEGLSERIEAPVAQAAPAPAKERRRSTRKPKAAAVAEAPAAEPAPVAESAAAVEATAEAAGQDETADEGAEAKAARKKTARPAHKAPARKSAPRSRRPAKPKTPPESA
ncbi:NYN domain-containing protein [Massilia agilis]|uniref:NYN domain-containing protein n=1 Tax=Massilia agilis TaxID=1811226 RepID=A0ABT2D6K6_9BURK|nr:NYN domain-containing protein [Massilia agilis]MCS0806937.1 NYN domain-containing protein [Massilia agilis]